MTPKPYNTEDPPTPVAAEPAAVYGGVVSNNDGAIPSFHTHNENTNMSSRMSVDEYFDELWSLYLKKRGVA